MILENYKNHPSALAIVQNPDSNFETFSVKEVEARDVALLLKCLDGKNLQVLIKYPPKLVSLAANELTVPLTNAINCSIRNFGFPENAKKVAVCPLDKGESNRTAERNFHPVSVLSTFSKIYEKKP